MPDQQFTRFAGRTPPAEIRRTQVQKATQLLEKTDLSLEQVAGQCGFAHLEYLGALFKREYGQTPRSMDEGI